MRPSWLRKGRRVLVWWAGKPWTVRVLEIRQEYIEVLFSGPLGDTRMRLPHDMFKPLRVPRSWVEPKELP